MKRSSTVLSLAVMATLIGGAVQAGPSRHEDDKGRDGYSQRSERGEQRGQSKSRQVTVKKVTVTKGHSGKAHANKGHSAKTHGSQRAQRHAVGQRLDRNKVVVVNNYHTHGFKAPGRDRVYVQQGDAIYLAAAATLAILAVMN
ncbi:hypothetical protein [Roseovarius sp.]|uniref:hypothetical protein n=1 Tax=Roseovarius sp. TaxID=1486281 RepID=UPI0035194A09